MKEFYFLTSMPRSGNTLLASIINQNPQLNITANSITPDIIYQLHLLKNNLNYKNFPDEISLDNVIKNVFINYYKDWTSKHIIDRSAWGTPANLYLLKTIIKKPKFIILYRPVIECLASFIKIEKPKNVELRCRQLMETDGMIGSSLWSIKNIIQEKENYIIIKYLDLVCKPLNQINKIYKFLSLNNFIHNLEKLKDFSVNNVKYDDSVLDAHLHKIRTDKIELNEYSVEDYIPKNILEQFSNLDI